MTQTKKATDLSFFSLVVFFSGTLLSNALHAEPFMTKTQYEDYSVLYQCAEQRFHDDLAKKEEVVLKLEDEYGINDDTFEAFDALIPEFEQDGSLLDNVRARVKKECASI